MTSFDLSIKLRNKVEASDVEAILDKTKFEFHTNEGKITVCEATLPNGFVLVESSGTINMANFDFEQGKSACIARIKEKVWMLEAYSLANDLWHHLEQDGFVSLEIQQVRDVTGRIIQYGDIVVADSDATLPENERIGKCHIVYTNNVWGVHGLSIESLENQYSDQLDVYPDGELRIVGHEGGNANDRG